MNVQNKLDFLQIQEVTTDKQKANGTREFKLPVRDQYGAAIHVASFASGYVRRTKAGGYCPSWQLNKRMLDTSSSKFATRTCELILDEQERIEYLIAFCLKNYYIKQSNMLSSGEFIPTWKHVDELNHVKERYDVDQDLEVKVIVNGQRYNII